MRQAIEAVVIRENEPVLNGKDEWTNNPRKRKEKVTRSEIKNMLKCSILWEGNKISTVKKFGSADCLLCGMEKYWILELGKAEHGCINQNNDIYKSCPHRPRVLDLFAEDSVNDEKWTTKKI